MAYTGHERRKHKVLVTRNTEYHLREDVCVAVRDRLSGDWRHAHMALDRRVSGVVRIHDNGACIPDGGEPRVGDAVFFSYGEDQDRQLVTSRVERITRPDIGDLRNYVGLQA